jgi:2-dehydropantoate 2-reductase
MKTQDTVTALDALRDAGLRDQPVFCAQNGVANERFALRRFPNVHGVTVMMPAIYLTPGEVACFSSPRHGIFEIGRYPDGADPADEALAAALDAANIAAFVTPDIMASKYGKLLLNLGNVIEAAVGRGPDTAAALSVIRDEARVALDAAGIVFTDVATDPRRDELMRQRPVEGVERVGGSSTQSLARGAGSIETDWLNGEIVLLGRLHGVQTPANAYCVSLGARLVREKRPAGSVPLSEIETALAIRP